MISEFSMRGSFCWQKCVALNHESAGSIPAPAALGAAGANLAPGNVSTWWHNDAESSNGKTRRSERRDVGSTPASAACEKGSLSSPVVQRQRRLVHIQETMVRLHPGLLPCDRPAARRGQSRWYVLAEQLECSPLCHGGDRGFKSRRGRCYGTVRNLAKRRSSNLRVLWVRLPPVLLQPGRAPHGCL